jgi:hypothetical protein
MTSDPKHDSTGTSAEHSPQHHEAHRASESSPPPGLAVADGRRLLEASPTIIDRVGDAEFEFRVLQDGEPLASFDELHERQMHLIVVRRDLTGFQHVHPQMDHDGRWITEIAFSSAGVWRAFADFSAGGMPSTLGVDVLVRGQFDPQPLPDPSTSAVTSADEVTLERRSDGVHRFTVVADGTTVRPEPYLGALGHLVVLRWGDLAFLHVHPVSRDELAFQVHYPTPGTYRCFLQYVVSDEVRTAAFTSVV